MNSRLHSRVILSVTIIATLGLSTLALYINFSHQRTLTEQNQKALTSVLEASEMAVNSMMTSGYADIGEVLAESLNEMSEVMDIQVAKLDGNKAFENNLTINRVNNELGYQRFDKRKEEQFTKILNFSDAQMMKILQQKEVYEEIHQKEDGTRAQTLYLPIKKEASCARCHAGNSDYLGWVKLQTSMEALDRSITRSRWVSGAIVVATLALIVFIVHQYVRRVILPPVVRLSGVISNITGQNLTETIELVSHVEFSRIANIFNLMVHRLSLSYEDLKVEQRKLSTLILDSGEGIVVTDQDDNIVLINDAAKKLLNKTEAKIRANGIAGLFDEVQCPMDTIIEGQTGTVEPRKIPYREQIFQAQVAEVLTGSGDKVGSAAIFKDITEESRLRDQLQRLARTDGLTGLFNRRHFDETANNELARAKRYSHPVSLMIFDIDHFKKVNDTFGHDVGDVAIKAVADIAKARVREFDLICRYGGEEYVILLPNTTLELSSLIAEDLRQAVEAWSHDDLKITISIGVAGAPPLPLTTSDDLIKAADKQLYKAKNNGRNQVQIQWKLEDLA